MSFQGFYTTKGLALAAKLAAGTQLTVTKVTAGSGETAKSATALAGEKQTLTAGTAAVSGQSAVLPVTLAETSVSAAYSLTELGIYARDPDAGEILFQVFRLDKPLPLTAGGENACRFYLKQTMGAAGIAVTCSPAGLLTDEDLQPLRTSLAKKPDAVRASTVLHVAKTGSDDSGDGSEAAPYLTIQKAVDSLPQLLLNRVIIRVHGGTYDEDVLLSGFCGFENLVLQGASGESARVKTVYVYLCTPAVSVENLTLTGVLAAQYNGSLLFSQCRSVLAEQITCTGAVASAPGGAFRFNVVGMARVTNCVISNKPIALDVNGGAVYLNDSDTGTGNTVGIRCGSAYGRLGGYVQKGGAAFGGEEQKGYGGQIW